MLEWSGLLTPREWYRAHKTMATWKHGDREGGDHVTTEAEAGAMWLRAEGCRRGRQSRGSWARQGRVSCGVSEEHGPAHALLSAFWPPGLWDNNFLAFRASRSIALCHGRPRNEHGCTARIRDGPRSSRAKARTCASRLRCVPTPEKCAFSHTVTIQRRSSTYDGVVFPFTRSKSKISLSQKCVSSTWPAEHRSLA